MLENMSLIEICFCVEYYKQVPEAMLLRSMDNSRQASCIEKPRSAQVLLSRQSRFSRFRELFA